jgi:predicted kinase
MATLYFLCGKTASGKTTLARRLAAEHDAAIICEDEWLVRLDTRIETFDDFVIHSQRLRAAMTPHVIQLLRLGTSVVLDFPANTPKDRAWVRSLFEAGHAGHELHVIDAPDDLCKARLRSRNKIRPEGLYWGHVPEALFDPVTRHLVPPAAAEGFNVIQHEARAS